MNLKNFNVVQPQEQPKEEVNNAVKMANISIRVDANCFLLCDGEFTEIELQAGKITKVQLPVGQHLLEFNDTEYPELKVEKVVEWPDEGKSYLVLVNEFKEIVDALKAKAEAERKAKEEAKRQKTVIWKVEDYIYELDNTKYIAKLTKGKGEKVVLPPIISCLDNDYRVTAIGNSAFSGCSSLTSIVVPKSVTSIGDHAFSGCSSLEIVIIPDGVTRIGDHAFSGCSSLVSMIIPECVTRIGDSAFSSCSSLTSIVIPDSVISIGEKAFSRCSSLTSITFNGTTEKWGRIDFSEGWRGGVPAKVVDCFDAYRLLPKYSNGSKLL